MLHEFVVIWLPTIASAIAVFIISSVIHMATKWHANDTMRLPNEDAVANLVRDLPGGEYRFPYAASMAEMRSPEFEQKVMRGPVGVLGVRGMHADQKGLQNALVLWFLYSLVVSWLAGHLAHVAIPGPTDTHDIAHAVGLAAYLGYGVALAQNSIWSPTRWKTTLKQQVDALLYATATAAIFVWLWPNS
jgi:hypothetical protein